MVFISGLTAHAQPAPRVLPGLEVLLRQQPDRLAGKRIGILTNPTGVDLNLVSCIDRIRALPGVTVVRLFAPEHGVRGGFRAGESIADARDPVSGLPVISLHGANRRPPADSLRGLDAVVYDIQDIGARSYTFVSTLTYMMEACEKAGVEMIVLDRPDPMGGDKVGGPMLDEGNISFIGIHNVASVYGLTPGEWARLIKLERTPKLELTVIAMKGWQRGMEYGATGLPWVPPSEHIPQWITSYFYSMTGPIGELGTVSNGVGTPQPFELIGTPTLNNARLKQFLDSRELAGVIFREVVYKPRYAAFSGKFVNGLQIHITNYDEVDPSAVQWALLEGLRREVPGMFAARQGDDYGLFRKSIGDNAVLRALVGGGDLASVRAKVARDLEAYRERRAAALIYP